MKRLGYIATFGWIAMSFAICLLFAVLSTVAHANGPSAEQQAQLQRHYAMRSRLDQDRRNRDNEARAFGNLSQGGGVAGAAAGLDNPTVTAMRSQIMNVLNQQGDMLKCNDIEVNNGSGNTVVVCDSPISGDVESTRTEIGGDQVNVINGGVR